MTGWPDYAELEVKHDFDANEGDLVCVNKFSVPESENDSTQKPRRISIKKLNVWFWHLTDISPMDGDFRFRG